MSRVVSPLSKTLVCFNRVNSTLPTFVERLNRDTDEFQARMRRYGEFNVFIVCCWHPHSQTSIIDKHGVREVQDI